MHNPLLLSTLLSAIVAQILKIPVNYWVQRSWNWRAALRPGGMPSSHTALMIGLTTATLLEYGWNNPYFAITTAVSMIVIYDAEKWVGSNVACDRTSFYKRLCLT